MPSTAFFCGFTTARAIVGALIAVQWLICGYDFWRFMESLFAQMPLANTLLWFFTTAVTAALASNQMPGLRRPQPTPGTPPRVLGGWRRKDMKHQNGSVDIGVIGGLIGIVLVLAFVYGWIANIVALAHSDFAHMTGMLVLRCIGVLVAPLGAVLGFC